MERTEKKLKPRPQEQQQGLDRIGDLPDGVALYILSFLETRDAVRTSVLSRRWQFLWRHVPNLVFNLRHGSLDKPQMRSLYRTLSLHSALKVLMFSLHLDGDEWPHRRVNRLVRCTGKRHVEELDLCLSGTYGHELPHCIFSHESLRKLRLQGCTVWPPERVSWGSLRVLHVESADLKDIEKVLSGCASLESLILRSVCLSGRVHIVHKKIKTLVIDYPKAVNNLEVRVNAPRLEELEFLRPWFGISFKLINVPSLVRVHLDFYFMPYYNLGDVDSEREKKIFQMVGHSKELWLGCYFPKILADREMIKSCPTLYNRDCLILGLKVRLGDLKQWILGMFSLIHHSPNLARLVVDFQDCDGFCQLTPTNNGIAYKVCSPNDGFAYTPDDGLEDWMSITEVDRFLSNLKTIEIHGIAVHDKWFKFVEILFKLSTVLEKMIIFSRSSNAALPQVAETLSTLTRYSPRVTVSIQEEILRG